MEENMSTNIAELQNNENLRNIQQLSTSIEKDIDNGITNKYVSESNLDQIQQMQISQLEELKNMQKIQLKNKNAEYSDTESESSSESDEKTKKKNKKKNKKQSYLMDMMKEPLILFFLYIFISHESVLDLLKNYIPNIVSDEITIFNLCMRGIIFVSLYLIFKIFLL